MNLKLLIDGIVRQTTVLIAQLSTASGVRAPLSHVADHVFRDLAREIEAQGVRKQVVADMFGMALRSYQKKMQRLTESATVRDRTLWEAVVDLIGEEQPTRARVLERFHHDGEREVASVLRDLVKSGLVYVTGSGEAAIYGITSDATRVRLQQRDDLESLSNLGWLAVFRGEARTRAELTAWFGDDQPMARAAVDELLASGRVREVDGQLESENVTLPIGLEQGWEAAMLDHFRTVAVAIATKVRSGFTGAKEADRIGGSTFTFTVEPGHPHEQEVYDLLRTTRLRAQAIWDRVAAYNEEHPPGATSAKVSFYVGQTLEVSDDDRTEQMS